MFDVYYFTFVLLCGWGRRIYRYHTGLKGIALRFISLAAPASSHGQIIVGVARFTCQKKRRGRGGFEGHKMLKYHAMLRSGVEDRRRFKCREMLHPLFPTTECCIGTGHDMLDLLLSTECGVGSVGFGSSKGQNAVLFFSPGQRCLPARLRTVVNTPPPPLLFFC